MKLIPAVALAGLLVAGTVGLAAAPAAADGPPAQCGFWSDTQNHSHWGNCRPTNINIEVHTWVGSNWTRCVPGFQTTDLGNGINIRTANELGGC